jgi:transposase
MADARTWTKRVAEWRSSGQTADAFSAGRGFAPGTLRWWASRLERRKAGFIRVVRDIAPTPERDAAIEIEIGGVRVLVRAGFDRDALAKVLDVVRGGGRS